jgi:hypothetical protein
MVARVPTLLLDDDDRFGLLFRHTSLSDE